MLSKCKFKGTLTALAGLGGLVAVVAAFGSVNLLVGFITSFAIMLYFVAERFLTEASEVFMQVRVRCEDGTGYSVNDMIIDVFPVAERREEAKQLGVNIDDVESWYVVVGKKLVVVAPYLCYQKTDRLLGLAQILAFEADEKHVQQLSGGKVLAYIPAGEDIEAEVLQRMGELAAGYHRVMRQLEKMYSPEYVQSLQNIITKMQDQFEKLVLTTVETGQVPRITEGLSLSRGMLVKAAVAVTAVAAIILLLVVVL